MGDFSFIQGQPVTLFVNFVDELNTPVTTGVSGVTIDISHFVGATEIFDIAGSGMTQSITDPQRWEYLYNIPATAPITNYIVEYNALFSGTSLQTTDSFGLFPLGTAFITGFGSGDIACSGTVVDPSGVGISGVNVTVTSGVSALYAAAFTDASGNYNVSLDTGDFVFSFIRSGFFPLQETKTIVSGVGSTCDLGLTTLQIDETPSLLFTDSFVLGDGTPLPNLRVDLYVNDTPSGDPPLSTVYTNASGVWFLEADPGFYVLDVNGEMQGSNASTNNRFKFTRNIEVNSRYTNNFDYLNTSKYSFLG